MSEGGSRRLPHTVKTRTLVLACIGPVIIKSTAPMILKSPSTTPLPSNPRLRAGVEAERQMAHYLHRAFATSVDLYVINDLRLVDPEQPEPDPRTGGSSPGVAQIDHLVLHRYGAFIVESKSVTGTITVRDSSGQGGGGDEWTRGGTGMPSPLRQAERQGEFLRAFLQRHREQLLGKTATGLRTIAKLVAGTDQRGFGYFNIQTIVAIADQGQIKRVGNWTPPNDGCRAFVLKADNVPATIASELKEHAKGARFLVSPERGVNDPYGQWKMSPQELGTVADFLVANHTPRSNASTLPSPPEQPKPAPSPAPAAADAPTPPCPRCGMPTVLRYAKKGANAGQPFFGCPTFPKCRGVVAIAARGES